MKCIPIFGSGHVFLLFSVNAHDKRIDKNLYYMAKASGRYNARSDWLRARSEQGITHS